MNIPLKFQTLVRSLLLGLTIVLFIVAPGAVKAIAPEVSFQAQLVNSTSSNDLDNSIPFSQMPGGQTASTTSIDVADPTSNPVDTPNTTPVSFVPRQRQVTVNPSNYDHRMSVDIYGNPVNNAPIIVLHETVGSARSAINTFLNTHLNDNDQVSYHSLITRDGTIVYLVPPEMRAFGAGNSVFNGANGAETVRLDPVLSPSVNNFAYHTSLESPIDGRGNSRRHSGYTEAQYRSLAWLVAQTRISEARITTHQAVDRSGSRRDPRSFDTQRFLSLLRTYTFTDGNQ